MHIETVAELKDFTINGVKLSELIKAYEKLNPDDIILDDGSNSNPPIDVNFQVFNNGRNNYAKRLIESVLEVDHEGCVEEYITDNYKFSELVELFDYKDVDKCFNIDWAVENFSAENLLENINIEDIKDYVEADVVDDFINNIPDYRLNQIKDKYSLVETSKVLILDPFQD